MSIFDSILSKLGLGDDKKEVVSSVATPAVPVTDAPVAVVGEIDVFAHLTDLAASHAEKLNWKVSIVDLMKLLGIDSSLAMRKELATELGCPSDKMSDSAQMNLWLHKTVLQKLAANGGHLPEDLLH